MLSKKPQALDIAVLVRVESVLRVPWIAGDMRPEDFLYEVNQNDRCAMEIALRLGAAQGGRVTAISWSPAQNLEALRYAMAGGVEHAFYLDHGPDEADGQAICRILAPVMQEYRFDLILCGTQSQAALGSPLAPLLAGLLSLSQVTRVVDCDVRDGMLYASRSLEGGVREEVACGLPAVVSVLPGERIPPYVSYHRRMAVNMDRIERRLAAKPAASWVVKEITPPRRRTQNGAAASPAGSASERMKQMLAGGKKEPVSGQVFTGTAQATAARLFAYLQEHGFIQKRDED